MGLVSIIIATFNRANYIGESLNSIINQNYKNWECIIIDDGSTDNTLSIVNYYSKKDTRFRYYKRANQYRKGISGCRNYGINLARGEYYVFFDDDDIAHPENLSITLNYLNNYRIDFCHYKRVAFNESFDYNFDQISEINFSHVTKENVNKVLNNSIPFNSTSVVWRNYCFLNIKFNENLDYAEDWECYLKIILSGLKGISLDCTLYYGRKHLNSNTAEFYRMNENRVKSMKDAIICTALNFTRTGNLNFYAKKYLLSQFMLYKGDRTKCLIKIMSSNKTENYLWTIYALTYNIRKKMLILRKTF